VNIIIAAMVSSLVHPDFSNLWNFVRKFSDFYQIGKFLLGSISFVQKDKQTNRQTNKQTNRQTDRQAH